MAARSSNRNRRRPSANPIASGATTPAHAARARNTNAATASDFAASPRNHPERPREGSRLRRSRTALEDAVERAASAQKKAIALYQLAVFHDNNARESVAIPLY